MALSAKPSRLALSEVPQGDTEIDERLLAVRTPGREIKSSQSRKDVRVGRDGPVAASATFKESVSDGDRTNKLLGILDKR